MAAAAAANGVATWAGRRMMLSRRVLSEPPAPWPRDGGIGVGKRIDKEDKVEKKGATEMGK